MKKFAVLVFIFLLFGGQAWGSADTLLPRADGTNLWSHTGCPADSYYQCVDDPPGSPDENTYAYTSAVSMTEAFHMDSTFVSNIDSIVIRINAKGTGTETKLYVGWEYYSEALWYFEIDDSVTLTDSWADYSVMSDEVQAGYSWTYGYINARRFGVRTPAISYGDLDTIKQDDFNDNSLDGDFWATDCDGGDATCTACAAAGCPDNVLVEADSCLKSKPYDNKHCGAWVVSDSSAYLTSAIYTWEFKWYTTGTWASGVVGYGRDGFFIVPQSWPQQTLYGNPMESGIHFLMGNECGNDNDGILIQADADEAAWDCDWNQIVAVNSNTCIVVNTWYDVRVFFNGSTGLCSLIVGDSIVTGTVNSTNLTHLGDSIKFVWGSSYYANDTEGKEDYMDDFLFTTQEIYTIDDQLTQVFVIVYTAEAAEGVSPRRIKILQLMGND